MGWRRWSAVFMGLVGMMLILRPGTAGFSPNLLWAVIAVTALAFRDLVTRLAPDYLQSVTLSTWGFMSTVLSAICLTVSLSEPVSLDPKGLIYAAGAALVTTHGYYAITTARRMAPASVVAPFRYTRLIFTTGVAIAVFDQWPDGATLVGSAIIIGSGLYSFARERQLAMSAR